MDQLKNISIGLICTHPKVDRIFEHGGKGLYENNPMVSGVTIITKDGKRYDFSNEKIDELYKEVDNFIDNLQKNDDK